MVMEDMGRETRKKGPREIGSRIDFSYCLLSLRAQRLIAVAFKCLFLTPLMARIGETSDWWIMKAMSGLGL